MQLSSILSNIPFLRNLRPDTSQSPINEAQQSITSSRSAEEIRQKAIEDTVEISTSASRSLQNLDAESELSGEEVLSILDSTRSTLESNDNFNLGLDPLKAQNL